MYLSPPPLRIFFAEKQVPEFPPPFRFWGKFLQRSIQRAPQMPGTISLGNHNQYLMLRSGVHSAWRWCTVLVMNTTAWPTMTTFFLCQATNLRRLGEPGDHILMIELDPVGSTVRYEMMKLCTGSV